tara:strand:+ start:42429 stop:42815 length:387 start_codon:yes stop_codon:yes gene_type:complete
MLYYQAAFMALIGQEYVQGALSRYFRHPNEQHYPQLADSLMGWGIESYLADDFTVVMYPHGTDLRMPECAVAHHSSVFDRKRGNLATFHGCRFNIEYHDRRTYAVAAGGESVGFQPVAKGALPAVRYG